VAQLHIALTFDFDGPAPILNTDRDVTWLSHAEAGVRVGAPRFLDYLRDREITSTWFVPGHTLLTFPQIATRIIEDGHEVGHHGFMHEDPSRLDEPAEREMLEKGIVAIQNVSGAAPLGYRAPYWRSSARTQRLLIEYGFRYDSSLMGDDYRVYEYRESFTAVSTEGGPPSGALIEVPVAWHREDGSFFEIHGAPFLPQRSPAEVAEIWEADLAFAYAQDEAAIVTLTIHPEISGRGGRFAAITDLIDRWIGRPHVGFVRLCDYTRAGFTSERR
jgi:peptidoglycan/xylan/chitin deacetylase (PgdA/CDA1 family)